MVCAIVGGCSMASKVVAVGPKTNSNDSSTAAQITMPDLRGLTLDQAKAALARAGSTGPVDSDTGLCGDDDQVAHLHVCMQSPDPGAAQASESPVHVVLNQESPDSSQPGVPGAHYKMPDTIGLSPAQVKTKLAAAGFSQADNFSVHIDGDCNKAGLVCRSEPAPGELTVTGHNKVLFIGQTQELFHDFMLFE